MDDKFFYKFSFIFGAIQGCLFIIGIVLGMVYIGTFSYEFGELKERVNVLEIQNPIKESK